MSKCAKVTHPTLLVALVNRSRIMARGRRPLRVYRCNRCRAYHMTRKPPRYSGKQWHVGCA